MDMGPKRATISPTGAYPPVPPLSRGFETDRAVSARRMDEPGVSADSYRAILSLAAPLILSYTGYMLMQFMDALFLSWLSAEAVAAAVPASMACFLVMSVFLGVSGYTSTFVAQYMGAKRPERVGAAVWQGFYFALASGVFVGSFALMSDTLFGWFGHDPEVRELEAQYFRIVCAGAPLALAGSAISGFFTGRGDTRTLMAVQLFGVLLNGVLDYFWIFGAFGWAGWGIQGAAAATVAAKAFIVAALAILFFKRGHRRDYGTWRARGFDRELFGRLARFGFPGGVRFTVEIFAWTLFLVFVGRVGPRELAATSIAWRINGIAFFPIIGLSTAISILVGQAQGAERSERAVSCTKKGLLLSEAWMLAAAALFVLVPGPLFELFHDAKTVPPEAFAPTREMGEVILRFVALYCLVDGFNIVLMGALHGAGDTRWTLKASAVLHALFLIALLVLDALAAGLYALWIVATAFVMLQAFVWLARFASGRWKEMRVIEPAVPEGLAPACE